MCLISYKNKSICFLPEKTGSTTIAEILCRNFEFKEYKNKHSRNIPPNCTDYFLFGTVRNPYEREISRYLFYKNEKLGERNTISKIAKSNDMNFEKWIDYIDYSFSLTKYYENLNLSYFIKLENIKNDFSQLPFYKEVPEKNWKLHRRKRKSKEEVSFTENSKKTFIEKFNVDFINFGYDL